MAGSVCKSEEELEEEFGNQSTHPSIIVSRYAVREPARNQDKPVKNQSETIMNHDEINAHAAAGAACSAAALVFT